MAAKGATTAVAGLGTGAIEAFGKPDVLVAAAAVFTSVYREDFEEIQSKDRDVAVGVDVRSIRLGRCAAAREMCRGEVAAGTVSVCTGENLQGIAVFSPRAALLGVAREVEGAGSARRPPARKRRGVRQRTDGLVSAFVAGRTPTAPPCGDAARNGASVRNVKIS